jgi:tRNA-5-methyluridine54 2-sulfurtransferase
VRCIRCKAPANVEVRRHRSAFCAGCYPDWFRGQVERAIRGDRMLGHSQRVLVAISGGKDSLALWHALTRLGYQADGMHIRLGIGGYSRRSQEASERFAERFGLTLHQVDLKEAYGYSVPQLRDQREGKPCAACGTVKRYHFNKVAVDLGYDVVATGHNLDDEAATLFGNVIHWQTDFLGRQGPVLESTHPRLARKVKPLYRLAERDTAAYAIIERLDYILEECPLVAGAKSLEYKDALNRLEDSQPGLKQRFLVGFLKSGREAVGRREEPVTLRECAECGGPTTTEVCAYCRMRHRRARQAS